MFLVFNWVSHFLRICILLIQKILKYVLNDIKFLSFFVYEYQKCVTLIQICEYNREKV
jgi:hypothetical protein